MTDTTPPSEAEGQHIGTFWVLNLGQEQGTEPGQRADTDPYRATDLGREADAGPGRGQRADTDPYRPTDPGRGQAPPVPYTKHDSDPYRVRAGLAPALVPLVPLVPRIPVSIVPRIPATFMRVGPEVAQELAQAMELEDAAVVLQRFARGCQCYAGRIDGRLVIYGWVTFDEESIGELGLSFRLQPGEAYIWDCATLPAFRGQRLYPALLAYMLGALYRAGMHRIWIGADEDNLPSQRGFILAGFTPVVDILMTGDATMRKPRVRGRPGIPEEIVDDVRQAIFGKRDHQSQSSL